ncbi:glycosyltransferase family 2 protein [Kineococcus sp. SYSU DK004]|uniref:glycosyltransferase n=1 Tax=Kineococcus sp. SYSU DK004 TaxID=3383125 RepID=UPI003D7EB359
MTATTGALPHGGAFAGSTQRLDAEYVLPLRWSGRAEHELGELAAYLRLISDQLHVTVVDGSDPDVFDRHAAAFGDTGVRHVRPEPWPGRNGKVAGVVTGVRLARSEFVVVADDDVRYGPGELRDVLEALDDADVVVPQNAYSPLPWHARWDTARTLVNRATWGDSPGTLGLRRSLFTAMGGYDGDVLYENLQLVRTAEAAGGRVAAAPWLYVRRLPPTAAHFRSQRVRQAYDDFAQPARLAVEATWLPLLVLGALRPKLFGLAAASLLAGSVGVAEAGRRRARGARHFPADGALWAPLWVLERSVCVWLAIGARARGGVRYAGSRVPHAARRPRPRVTGWRESS